jgi:hypothetical protein
MVQPPRGSGAGPWMPLLAGLVALAVGCHSLNFLRPREKDPPAAPAADGDTVRLPSKYQIRVAPVVFLSDFEIRPDLPLFKELAQLREQVQKELLLPPATDPVTVYLFETEKAYSAYMKSTREYKDLPDRRAFFVAQPRGLSEDLLVYTYWSKRIRQDLRHELTHALLHSVIKEVPQWLDEGIAEYFELRPELEGVNPEHVRRLRRELASGDVKPDVARLEGLTQVEQMKTPQYRESWAWVHLMLRGKPEGRMVLLSYLQQLRGTRHPGPLLPRLQKVYPDPGRALREHLDRLEAGLPPDAVVNP